MIPTALPARPRHPVLDLPGSVARELGELATTALTAPLACTELGHRALRRPLTARAPRAGSDAPRTPVVLVHGYGGGRAGWLPLERRLAREGFRHVHNYTYDVLTRSVPEIARALAARCAAAAEEAGTERVDVVGHSLGGVVLRCAVARHGLAPRLSTAVTVAAPHRGTRVALLGPGTVAASLRPGSALLAELCRQTWSSDLRWVAYYADRDLVVPAGSARLAGDVPGARDVLVPGAGHLGVLRAPAFLDSVVGLLRDRDRDRDRATAAATDRRRRGGQAVDARAA
ncbi:esterase/lipase family protein [Blastococcus sp. VKM Ac-2987]|uniref:esterase/lipase family protein n=1 Tax=Blastococcus sp. VKM Ac-2987 TaxID=3004141 RepID=UPI0022AB822F|nr:alpha/beta fold hydrolase [Blastococcus sp. VKM Ac-2987]MCZ2860655.1 alpha/beta fold hydrolase [Blastococcus sp. VKM Ac-2987]